MTTQSSQALTVLASNGATRCLSMPPRMTIEWRMPIGRLGSWHTWRPANPHLLQRHKLSTRQWKCFDQARSAHQGSG
jgi:hypothetical protein